ncbi:ABC transporter ATP-binding protein [Candidatus Deianiraea vastatrix]|uniref:Lipid A export-like ABC transporter permease n=1 Tax=Candidatus Deianiraea vastatrix TaxID=2163644 RepID=A0A5B8XEZ0_9RICK|nr:ABC transporter ATP-binding protein [Candidatus Deianiraea vastatrix]QED23820.1 Putative lipid A export-like ABC transporter permease [Candidatus Deianiraea vastatrix]
MACKKNTSKMDWTVWTKFISMYVKPNYILLCVSVVLMIIAAIATAASAQLMDPIINKIFISKDIKKLWNICGMILIVFFTKSISVYLYKLIISIINGKISRKISQDLFSKLISLNMDDISKIQTGKIITYFNTDIRNIRQIIESIVIGVAKELFTIFFLVGLMFWKSWQLSIIALIGFPIAFYPLIKLTSKLRKVVRIFQNSSERLNIFLQNRFDGIKTVKSFAQEDCEIGSMKKITNELFDLEIKSSRIGFIGSPLMEFMGGFAIALVILYGGYGVIDGKMTAGNFFSFLTALLMLYKPLKSTSSISTTLQNGYISIVRIFEIFNIEGKISYNKSSKDKDIDIYNPKIEIKDLSFSYKDKDTSSVILDNINLTIQAGEKIALVGESGGGKSTIVKLIMRFYDVSSGSISINGVNIKEMSVKHLRKNISYVSQEAFLFDESILFNLTYGISDYTEADIEKCLKLANAYDFIQNIPGKLNGKVGHMGSNLSTGQKQRLVIARAMLKNAPIIILDEATSALDNKTEKDVQDALNELITGKTTIIIAHRLSTVTFCDKILLLANGSIAESGKHEEMLKNENSLYYKLYHAHNI